MREGIVIVDADGHVMDRPHRSCQKYLPKPYAGRGVFRRGGHARGRGRAGVAA